MNSVCKSPFEVLLGGGVFSAGPILFSLEGVILFEDSPGTQKAPLQGWFCLGSALGKVIKDQTVAWPPPPGSSCRAPPPSVACLSVDNTSDTLKTPRPRDFRQS